jgi:photosystem II stability/assembly factor-like uncharacterized protein
LNIAKHHFRCGLTVAVLLAGAAVPATGQPLALAGPLDRAIGKALHWRNVGPFRGGRVTAVSGVLQDEHTFYMGSSGGGVWKTTDGGTTWKNVSDGYFTSGTIGAIAVAPSDPNVIYVGTGEHCVRIETFASGDGMYKSTDGGKTWSHIGLKTSRQIASVKIDPRNPEIVYVAVQGSPWGPQDDRGVYKSTDGGKTWALVLAGGPETGASDLAMDPANPAILYAAMWQHHQEPWHGYQITSGGPGSGLYKSTDAGKTWSKIQNGLPSSIGRIGIAVSAANRNRLYALVEARPEVAGLYRSDDAGASWKLLNNKHVMAERSGYYMHIVADPNKQDTVYVLHAPLLKSTDGGKSFSPMHPPHGDNHAMWINPKNSDWLIDGNDGGAHVTYTGGKSWSSELNQPTAQIYRLTVDHLFPYNLYGGQQDNSTPKIKSRSFGEGIGIRDWYDVGRGESAYVALDPDHPQLIYSGNYQGQIFQYDDRTGKLRNVQRYPLQTAYRPGELYHWRFNWNAPIVMSIHDRKTLYHGSQFLLKSTDSGQHWTEISPDLTRNDPRKHGYVAGEFTTDGVAGSMYNTIHYIAESPRHAGELWVGTDDGRVHLTRDEGKSWTEITPPGIGETLINAIELSPHQDGKAWVVATRFRFNDLTPNVFVTEDYGRTWKRKVEGIAPQDFVRIVREDPVRKGMLYAGSEHGLYVSFDDGDHWQSMQLNLPHVPVTDLRVHAGDLVASTQGRAFWILDDISPLRHLDKAPTTVTLFEPAALPQIRTSRGREGTQGENPPNGALIDFWLPPRASASGATLDILDSHGRVVNSYSAGVTKSDADSEAKPDADEDDGPRSAKPARLPAAAGLNRFVWDWQARSVPSYPELKAWRASRGYRVAPGWYAARLTSGGVTQSQRFQVLPDPRVSISDAQQAEKQALLASIRSDTIALLDAVQQAKAWRQELTPALSARNGAASAARQLDSKLNRWLDATVEIDNMHFIDPSHSAERLDFNLLSVLGMVDTMDAPITGGLMDRVNDVRSEWTTRRKAFEALKEEMASVRPGK